jgi:hypothetical protein
MSFLSSTKGHNKRSFLLEKHARTPVSFYTKIINKQKNNTNASGQTNSVAEIRIIQKTAGRA